MRTRKRLVPLAVGFIATLATILGLGVTDAGTASAATTVPSIHIASGGATHLAAAAGPSSPSHPGTPGTPGTKPGGTVSPHQGIADTCYFNYWDPWTTKVAGIRWNVQSKGQFQGCNFGGGECRMMVRAQYADQNGVWWNQPGGYWGDTGYVDCNALIGTTVGSSYPCANTNHAAWRTFIDLSTTTNEFGNPTYWSIASNPPQLLECQ